jgi:hypothetical protein
MLSVAVLNVIMLGVAAPLLLLLLMFRLLPLPSFKFDSFVLKQKTFDPQIQKIGDF